MIRTLTLAAAAVMLIAAPASAQSTTITVAGTSPEQLHAEINKAARKVCRLASVGASFPQDFIEDCQKATVRDTVAKLGDPAVAAVANIKLAAR